MLTLPQSTDVNALFRRAEGMPLSAACDKVEFDIYFYYALYIALSALLQYYILRHYFISYYDKRCL